MEVATFNINNINKRLDNLLDWLAKAEPDVVSLQELKAEQEAFPVDALRTLGYEAVWQSERLRVRVFPPQRRWSRPSSSRVSSMSSSSVGRLALAC